MTPNFTGMDVEELQTLAGCARKTAVRALRIRDGQVELALEYLERRDLFLSLALRERFPKWHLYLEKKRGVQDLYGDDV